MRPSRSAAPPAPNGTTTFTGRFGHSWACADGAAGWQPTKTSAVRAKNSIARILFSHLPPSPANCYHSGKEPAPQQRARQPGRREMEGHDNGVARRTVLMSAGVGIGAGLVSGLSSAHAEGAT